MQFINPYFLWGLIATGIPVVIHLFNFRRFKKVYFSNVSFLEELKLQTQKYSRLKHLIVLIMRILAIACLVFAFAQPFIPFAGTKKTIQGKNVVSIYVDNSFSMEALSDENKLLDVAKTKAREILSAYNNSDLFQLLTNDFEGKHQRLLSKDEFLEMLDEVEISPSVKKLSEITKRQMDIENTVNSVNKTSYIISDFQKSIIDINSLKLDTNLTTYFIPLSSQKTNNIYVDSCWFDTPVLQLGKTVKLIVKIKNASDVPYEKIPLKLMINGKQRAVASFDIKEKEELRIPLTFRIDENGIENGYAEITDYPLTYDDKYFFSFNVAENIHLLAINGDGESPYLNKLFKLDSVFIFKNSSENNIDYSLLKNNTLVVLNGIKSISSGLTQEIHRYVINGGSLLIFPSEKADLESYRQLTTALNCGSYQSIDTADTKIETINLNHSIFSDVFEKIPENIDLPKVFSHFTLNENLLSRKESLLKMQNGKDFLSVSYSGKGKIYLCATSLNTTWSNFPKHAIFVPALFNIALQSIPANKLSYTIGNDEVIEIQNILSSANNENVLKIKGSEQNFEIIPETKIIDTYTNVFLHNQIKKAGNYLIYSGDTKLSGISLNYDRNESQPDCYSIKDLNTLIKDKQLKNTSVIETSKRHLGEIIKEMNQGISLWKLFILFALFFLLGEVILLRVWK